MSDIFIEVLQNYLHGQEWKESVEIFVLSNCRAFSDHIKEYSHQQYQIWKSYQEIVEQILDSALQSVGGSLKAVEVALEDISRKPPRGPRDAMIKDVIKKLLTYESFEDFSAMMARAAEENIYEDKEHSTISAYTSQHYGDGSSSRRGRQSNHSRYEDTPSHANEAMTYDELFESLKAMGYETDMIEIVLSSARKGATLDSLVTTLGQLGAVPKGKGRSVQANSSQSKETSASGNSKKHDLEYLQEFANEVGVSDVNELFSKFTTAKSVFDILFEDEDTFSDTLTLQRWAADMLELHELIVRAYETETPCRLAQSEKTGLSLPAWFADLERTRKEVDEDSSSVNMLSDAELKRMADLDRIAASGSEDEQVLHHLLTRYDEVQRDINSLHKRLALVVAGDGSIHRNNLEELYLYLKEQVGSGTDLEAVADEMHERVYSLFPSHSGIEVVNVLLDMHLLEDEQFLLKRRINTMLGVPNVSASDSAAQAKEGSSSPRSPRGAKEGFAAYNMGPSTGRFMSLLSGATSAADDVIDAKYTSEQISSPRSQSKHSGSGSGSQDKSGSGGHGSSGSGGSQGSHSPRADSKHGQSGPRSAGTKAVDADNAANQSFLDDLKSRHKAALGNLKASIEADRAKRLKDLEEKLMNRRLRKGLKAGDGHEKMSEAEIKAVIESSVREVEEEISATKQHFEEMQSGLISGFKKRCVYELKAAKAKGGALNRDEQNECYKEAADALKKRFERDQKALLESLNAERSKQHAKLLKKLERRKKSASGAAERETFVADCVNEIELMNQSFDAQESEAIAKPHGDLMLALSAIAMDESVLVSADAAPSSVEDDDEDGAYLEDGNEPSDGDAAKRRKLWLDNVGKMRNIYMSAGQQIQQKMRVAHRQLTQQGENLLSDSSGVDVEGATGDNSVANVTAHMLNVVTEAYSSQIGDLATNPKFQADDLVAGDKVKAHILEEFEKARAGYDAAISLAKARSRELLDFRRGQRTKASDESQATNSQILLEGIVDSFLEDPIEMLKQSGNGNGGGGNAQAVYAGGLQLPYRKNVRLPPLEKDPSVRLGLKQSPSKRDVKKTEQVALVDEKDRIKQEYEEKERELVDGLHSQMVLRKHMLEEKLRKRREAKEKEKNKSKSAVVNMEYESDEEAITSEVAKLEAAFQKVVSLVNGAQHSQLDSVEISSLMTIMDRISRGEKVSALPEYSHAAKDAAAQREEDYKAQMQEEVKRISNVFNEEQQKLDLMLKMQQARQRQNLQRKLLERKRESLI